MKLAEISFLRPIDQPTGNRRLIDELRKCLRSEEFSSFRMVVAFAKSGPLLRLKPDLEAWKLGGRIAEAMFGIDHSGTSAQALELAMQLFDRAFVVHAPPVSTFHPKLYLFEGPRSATCYLGSHNLTVGGTETNFEAGVKIDMRLPDDTPTYDNLLSCWTSLLPSAFRGNTQVLDEVLFASLVEQGKLLDESKVGKVAARSDASSPSRASATAGFPSYYPKLPSAVPSEVFRKQIKRPTDVSETSPDVRTAPANRIAIAPAAIYGQTLAIQIDPHDNGEIFLSKTALKQNPSFFGFPFTGVTTPKKEGNEPGQQREPDPIANIQIFNRAGMVVWERRTYALNMVYYPRREDVRITVPPAVAKAIEPYSMLVMSMSASELVQDYEIQVYAPGTVEHSRYLSICNQSLPPGGPKPPRKMGWL